MLQEKLRAYVSAFNQADEECYMQDIPNARAEEFLLEQIPRLECPDAQLEKIYYFRWWTYRKHIKSTPDGHIITEFLPPVRWAGPYNSIVCPVGFHIREGRWLRDQEGYLREYIDFWLDGKGDNLKYSTWLAHSVWEYCALKGDMNYAVQKLPQLIAWFEKREKNQRRACGLYWSKDGRDGMEYSISGSGLRPTLNSYVYADAMAISGIAKLAGKSDIAGIYEEKAKQIKIQMDKFLWHEGFYRVLPLEENAQLPGETRPAVPPEQNARELLGYIPWYFYIPDGEKSAAFAHLMSQEGFLAPLGLTTAERRHPRFLEAHTHECLWNGPVWPFATSQTLVAAANLLRAYKQDVITREDHYTLLRQYAASHILTKADGSTVPWIDEDMDPFTGKWLAREHLEHMGWEERKGGYERGKDYNHSLFCDLILSGLLGIHPEGDGFAADPLIPDNWDYFRVENLWHRGHCYTITYDKTGCRYGKGKGLQIEREQK